MIRSHLFTLLADTKHEDCPLCRQRLTPEIRLRAIADVKGQSASQGDEQELAEVRRQIDVLQKSLMELKPDVLRMLWATVEQAEVDIHQKSAEIEELNRQLSGGRDDDVRRLRSDYDNLVGQIKALEDGVQSTTKALAENQTVRDRIQKQIDQKSGGRLKGASDRVALAARLQALFDEAVTVYRERLRHRVESDASAHFLSLTTEPDYKGLRINDNYGLTIIHKDGQRFQSGRQVPSMSSRFPWSGRSKTTRRCAVQLSSTRRSDGLIAGIGKGPSRRFPTWRGKSCCWRMKKNFRQLAHAKSSRSGCGRSGY